LRIDGFKIGFCMLGASVLHRHTVASTPFYGRTCKSQKIFKIVLLHSRVVGEKGALLGERRFPTMRPKGGRLRVGTARAEDAQGTPTESHISPSILVYED